MERVHVKVTQAQDFPVLVKTINNGDNYIYLLAGYSIASVLGGIIIQRLGGATNYVIFGVAALAVCGLHWLTFTKFIVNNVHTDGKSKILN
jgi:hypothetical protein